MHTNRRNFITTLAATGVGAALATNASAAESSADLPVPSGKEFEGMGGAFSALFTPFTEDNKVNEAVLEVLLVEPNGNETWDKEMMRYVGINCGNCRSPKGWSLTQAEHDDLFRRMDALGFVKKRA